jgi:hypothetical protein
MAIVKRNQGIWPTLQTKSHDSVHFFQFGSRVLPTGVKYKSKTRHALRWTCRYITESTDFSSFWIRVVQHNKNSFADFTCHYITVSL